MVSSPTRPERKPPDPEGVLTEEEQEWIEDINYANHNCNDKCVKPKIARIHFETSSCPILFNTKDEIPPYDYEDKDKRTIDEKEIYRDADDIKHEFEEQQYG